LDQHDIDPNFDLARELELWLQTNDCIEGTIFSPLFLSIHPAGGEEIVNIRGEKLWLPNKNESILPKVKKITLILTFSRSLLHIALVTPNYSNTKLT